MEPSARVLIVDDDPPSVYLYERVLRDAGFDVRLATGFFVIEIAEQWKPAVVLMDVRLPDVDGITLIGLLRQNHWTATTRVLAFSAFADYGAEAIDAGADMFIVKPRRPSEVLDVVQKLAAQGPRDVTA